MSTDPLARFEALAKKWEPGPIPPGPCWHDSGTEWWTGERPRCELLAGHAGAHTWTRPGGGEAVWLETMPADGATDGDQ